MESFLLGAALSGMVVGYFMHNRLEHCRQLGRYEYNKACVTYAGVAKRFGLDTASYEFAEAITRGMEEYERTDPAPPGPERSIWPRVS